MNLDDQLRSAYQRRLQAEKESFEADGRPPFEPTSRESAALGPAVRGSTSLGSAPLGSATGAARRVLPVAAAVLLLLIGFATVSRVVSNNESVPVQLDVSNSPQDVSPPDNSDPVDGDINSGLANSVLMPTSTPTPVPTATLVPTPTSAPTPTATPTVDPTAAAVPADEAAPVVPIEPTVESTTEPIEPAASAIPTPPPPSEEPTSESSVANGAAPTTVPTEPAPTSTPTAQPEPTATPTEVPAAIPTSTPEPTPTQTPEPTATPTATPTPSATPTVTPTAAPVYASGVPNSVCPSGARAELEFAALRYVGANTGWNRLFDLVNEQDGPFYFGGWEPGYPNQVMVEVALTEPVLASEIRVAQHPFDEVSGNINVNAGGMNFSIPLSGVDGWKSYTFDPPIALDLFTVERADVNANIMEVLICVEP